MPGAARPTTQTRFRARAARHADPVPGSWQTAAVVLGESAVHWVGLVLAGAAVIGFGSVAIGAAAPRWPARWLDHDHGPLRLLPADSPARYERLGARWLKRFFPELGDVFGGVSKSIPPDLTDPVSIRAYLVEVRRAEWVHWLSMLTWLPLPLFQPLWLALAFLVPTAAVNSAAQIILRYNRIWLYLQLDALRSPREG